jgi:radical SAM protein with 4Fe4S-binding SPASM domain
MGGQRDGALRPVPLRKLVLRAREILEREPGYLALLGRDAFSILGTVSRMSYRRRSCGTGLQTVLLDADGSLYPCLNCNMPEFRLGSVREPGFDFGRFWESAPKLLEHRRVTCIANTNEKCRACAVRYWCLGGCKGETYVNTGALNNPAVDCADQRAALLEMLWVLAERPELVRSGNTIC